MLHQVNPYNPKERQIVSCISRMLTDVERRYSQCEKEALGLVWSCERLWLYLLGRPFTIETDNRAVKMIFTNTKSRPPARIERLALRLSQFDFIVVHRPGSSNIADYFSRHPTTSTKSEFLEEIRASIENESFINALTSFKLPYAVTLDQVRSETKRDEELSRIVKTKRLIRKALPVKRHSPLCLLLLL